MSVFVDTGLYYALQNERAQRHDAAISALSIIQGGQYGRPFTSEYVYDEAVTLVRSRTGSFSEAKTVGDRIRGIDPYPDAIDLLSVTEDVFETAIERFDHYRDHPISFTDATTVALMDEHGVDHLLSFDDDFDGIVDRLEPASL